MAKLGGITIFPSTIKEERQRVGTRFESQNGSQRFIHRAYKSTWNIIWERILGAERTAIKNLISATSTLTFISDEGSSYTVFVDEQAYSCEIDDIGPDGTLYYNVSITLREA